jgi:hypothetical protein
MDDVCDVMRLQHTLSALLRVETGLKLAGNGLEVGSHDCVRRRNDRWWRGYEYVLRECLNGSKHFSRNLEARR